MVERVKPEISRMAADISNGDTRILCLTGWKLKTLSFQALLKLSAIAPAAQRPSTAPMDKTVSTYQHPTPRESSCTDSHPKRVKMPVLGQKPVCPDSARVMPGNHYQQHPYPCTRSVGSGRLNADEFGLIADNTLGIQLHRFAPQKSPHYATAIVARHK